MKSRIQVVAMFVAAGVVSAGITLGAHHSIANFWDATKTVSITGKVTLVKLVNPHSEITLEVMEDGKPVKWIAFGLGITDLRKRGITADMLMGKVVTMEGNPPKAATGKGVFVSTIILDNGDKLNIREAGAFRGTPSADKPDRTKPPGANQR